MKRPPHHGHDNWNISACSYSPDTLGSIEVATREGWVDYESAPDRYRSAWTYDEADGFVVLAIGRAAHCCSKTGFLEIRYVGWTHVLKDGEIAVVELS